MTPTYGLCPACRDWYRTRHGRVRAHDVRGRFCRGSLMPGGAE